MPGIILGSVAWLFKFIVSLHLARLWGFALLLEGTVKGFPHSAGSVHVPPPAHAPLSITSMRHLGLVQWLWSLYHRHGPSSIYQEGVAVTIRGAHVSLGSRPLNSGRETHHHPSCHPPLCLQLIRARSWGWFAYVSCLNSMACTYYYSQKPCVKAWVQPIRRENTNELAVVSSTSTVIAALNVKVEAHYSTQSSSGMMGAQHPPVS